MVLHILMPHSEVEQREGGYMEAALLSMVFLSSWGMATGRSPALR